MKAPPIDALLDLLRLGAELPRIDPIDNLAALLPLVRFEGAERWLFRRLKDHPAAWPQAAVIETLRSSVRGEGPLLFRQDEETRRVLEILAAAGIGVVAIKGFARRVLAPRIPYLDARPTRDIDLLVEPGRAHDAWDRLRLRGYQLGPPPPPNGHHLQNLLGEFNVGIELHTSIAPNQPSERTWERLGAGAEVVVWNGLEVRVPPASELAWHAAAHGLADGARGFRLQHLLPVAAVAAAGSGAWAVWEQRVINETIDLESGRRVGVRGATPWFAAARWLAGEPGPRPIGLKAVLAWRAKMLANEAGLGQSFIGRALAEGPRSELGFPPEGSGPGTALGRRLRRYGAAYLARAWYRFDRARI